MLVLFGIIGGGYALGVKGVGTKASSYYFGKPTDSPHFSLIRTYIVQSIGVVDWEAHAFLYCVPSVCVWGDMLNVQSRP